MPLTASKTAAWTIAPMRIAAGGGVPAVASADSRVRFHWVTTFVSLEAWAPMGRASEVFAERWTPLIVREIMSDHHHFSEILKGLHSISPSMLGQRLRSLEQKGVIETGPNPTGRGSTYYLTDAGRQLAEI